MATNVSKINKVKLYNNLVRKNVPFEPVEEGKVKFYSCGPTTYDFLHVGNARALVVGDLIHRILKSLGYDVTFVRNFTDVDDKIIERANELGIDAIEHAAKYVDECLKDMDSLGMMPATQTPKVSETMPEIIELVEKILANGHGYVADNGEVLFHVPSFEDYGKLSKKDLESLEHGKRVEVDKNKKHPSDFVLWKPAKPGEPSWDSPWGKGRPGWHIECSAMSRKFLGDTFDLHHGGVDLIFPHHENEIAQSEAANKCGYCNNWVHNEFLNFGSEKMSKSLGNVVTIRKFVETYGGKILRQILSSVHYRSRLEWTEEVIEKAVNDVERIHNFVQSIHETTPGNKDGDAGKIEYVIEKMKKALANDFNIPTALSEFFSLIRAYNRDYKDDAPNAETLEAFKKVSNFMKESTGLVHEDYKATLAEVASAKRALKGGGESALSDEEIQTLISERKAARDAKDWAKADEIRDKLTAAGVDIKDV